MRGLLKVGFALLAMAFMLIGVCYSLLRAQGASGPANPEGRMMSSETRSVGKGVSAVELSGPIDLTLTYGPVTALAITGEQRLLANIETQEEGGVLHIRTRGILLRHRYPLGVVLVLPALKSLSVDGSGDSSVDGFSGERIEVQLDGSGTVKFNGRYRQVVAGLHGSGDLDLEGGNSDQIDAEINGSGDMTLAGTTKALHAQVRGSGDFDARHLRADTVLIQQLGSGDSTVLARSAVVASVSGSGNIDVYGKPAARTLSRTGSGEINFND
jgi:hypothetical protein